jgi:hypothetical protein
MIRNCTLAKYGSTDWSLLELSILEQAKKTLEYQGGNVEAECGITDEGDPWLVFCDADTSNVLCHFARLGSDKYVACVPFDNVGTTGSALADVLDDFFSSPVGRGRALGLSSAVSHGKLRI